MSSLTLFSSAVTNDHRSDDKDESQPWLWNKRESTKVCQGQDQPASFVGSLSFLTRPQQIHRSLLRIDELISFARRSDWVLNYMSRSNLWIRHDYVCVRMRVCARVLGGILFIWWKGVSSNPCHDETANSTGENHSKRYSYRHQCANMKHNVYLWLRVSI